MIRSTAQALKNMRRAPYQALAALLLVSVTFLVGYALVLFLIGSSRVLNYFESRPQVTAFFVQDTPAETLQQYVGQLEQNPSIREVRYISQDEALEIYQQQIGEDPVLLELVTADILPPSIEVSTYEITQLASAAQALQELDGVDEVVFQQDIVDSLQYWSRILRLIGLAVLGVFTFVAVLILFIVTSIRVSSRKGEIRIMRLMGATKWYIQRPFLIEGMLYGMVGSVVAWGGIYIILLYASPVIQQFFGEVHLVPVPVWFMGALLAGGTAAGWIIGFLASFLSSRCLLRV